MLGEPGAVLGAPRALGPEARSLTEPDFTPVAACIGAGSQWSPPADDAFRDEAATCYGAVPYGDQANWIDGWIACPES